MKKFFLTFFIFSLIGLLFFRPLFLKREIEIDVKDSFQIKAIYYEHGFPMTKLIKYEPTPISYNEPKEYQLAIYPINFPVNLGITSDYGDVINMAGNRKVDIFKKDMHDVKKLYSIENPNKIIFNVKAQNYIVIRLLQGAVSVEFNGKKTYIDSKKGQIIFPIYLFDITNKIKISPESKKIIVQFWNGEEIIKIVKIDYLGVLLNCLILILYVLILSIILTFSSSLFLKHFSTIFTSLLIYLLAYFPGSYTYDSWVQILQVIGIMPFNDWHTLLHTISIGIVLKVFHHIASYSLFQIIFASILFAWILSKLKFKNLKLALFLVFAFPTTGLLLINAWKDTYYSLSLIWFSFLIYFAYQDKNYLKSSLNLLAFVISAMLVILFRHNGILVIIPVLIIMLFVFKEQFKKLLIITSSIILLFIIYQIIAFNILKIEKGGVRYLKVIDIISTYIVEGYKFDEKERKILEEIIPVKDIEKSKNKCYYYTLSNSHKLIEYNHEILKILLKAIIKDIKPLIENMICSSRFIWNPKVRTYFFSYTRDDYIYSNVYQVGLYPDSKLPHIQTIIEVSLKALTSILISKPLFKPITYILILLIVFLVNKNLRIVLLPSLLNTLVILFLSQINHFRFLLSDYLITLFLIFYFLKPNAFK